MLITELKSKETILSLIKGKVFIINCHGCKEVYFPEALADELIKELCDAGIVTDTLVTDYICNADNLKVRIAKYAAAIEAADVVFMTSDMTAIPKSIKIAHSTNRISRQNVIFAIAVKVLFMILGLCGISSMWLAVFADTGVAMLCILNSVRILYKK